jgi:hypothetical protein
MIDPSVSRFVEFGTALIHQPPIFHKRPVQLSLLHKTATQSTVQAEGVRRFSAICGLRRGFEPLGRGGRQPGSYLVQIVAGCDKKAPELRSGVKIAAESVPMG